MLKSFSPVADGRTRILIVGSMPGEASLRAGQYYAYKYNQFWKLAAALFSDGNIPPSYPEKLAMLRRRSAGLWDTLHACERQGSLDSQIRRARANDFISLLKTYPRIRALLFNGQTAHKYFVKFFGQLPGISYYILPSTSPAHAALSYEEKLTVWKDALTQALK